MIRPSILLLALGISSATACGGGVDPLERRSVAPVTVPMQVAELHAVPRAFHGTGSVHPRVRVSPGTKILGREEEVLVEIGDRVEAGGVLARLEHRDLTAAVAQAQAAIAMAEARQQNAFAQHERMRELHGRASVTDKDLEDATSSIRVADAAWLQARANLAAAEATLGYATIRSPIRGVVTAKRIESGDMARPGEPLFLVEDLARVEVVVTVPESEVVGLAPGDLAQLEVAVLETTRESVVESVNPAGDPRTRTFEVRLRLDNPDGRLKSGMFARASFERGSRKGLFVPVEAVVERGALRGLFVVDDESRGRLRWIRTGASVDRRVEVLSGLRPGERFVSAPPLGLADGTPVREG